MKPPKNAEMLGDLGLVGLVDDHVVRLEVAVDHAAAVSEATGLEDLDRDVDRADRIERRFSNKGREVLIPEYNLFDIGGFVFSQKSWDKVSVSGGIRFDSRSLNSKLFASRMATSSSLASKKQFSNFSGSAGVSYSPTNALTLKFNAARGFRAPSIPELASNGHMKALSGMNTETRI